MHVLLASSACPVSQNISADRLAFMFASILAVAAVDFPVDLIGILHSLPRASGQGRKRGRAVNINSAWLKKKIKNRVTYSGRQQYSFVGDSDFARAGRPHTGRTDVRNSFSNSMGLCESAARHWRSQAIIWTRSRTTGRRPRQWRPRRSIRERNASRYSLKR